MKLIFLVPGGLQKRIGEQNCFYLKTFGLNLVINKASRINRWSLLLFDLRIETMAWLYALARMGLSNRYRVMVGGGFWLLDTIERVEVLLRIWEGMYWCILMPNLWFVVLKYFIHFKYELLKAQFQSFIRDKRNLEDKIRNDEKEIRTNKWRIQWILQLIILIMPPPGHHEIR